MYFGRITGLDLAAETSFLRPPLNAPTKGYMAYAKRTLHFLNGSQNNELILRPGNGKQLSAHVSVSWADKSSKNCRSTTGLMVPYGDDKSKTVRKLQECASLSSNESV